jgi:hypothetical protein
VWLVVAEDAHELPEHPSAAYDQPVVKPSTEPHELPPRVIVGESMLVFFHDD